MTSNVYVSPFTGDMVQPTDVSYQPLNLTANVQMAWPSYVPANSGYIPLSRIIDVTENLPGRGIKRGNEIQCYIENHYSFKRGIGYAVKYAIIDDDSDMLYWHRDNFFHCDAACGLSQNIAYRVINHLGLK